MLFGFSSCISASSVLARWAKSWGGFFFPVSSIKWLDWEGGRSIYYTRVMAQNGVFSFLIILPNSNVVFFFSFFSLVIIRSTFFFPLYGGTDRTGGDRKFVFLFSFGGLGCLRVPGRS